MGASKKWIIGLALLSSGLSVAVIVLSVLLAGSSQKSDPTPSPDLSQPVSISTTMSPVISSTPALTEPWEIEYRLPTDTLPLHYNIYLHPNLVTGLFSGNVDIDITTKAERSWFVVHTKFLNITKTDVREGHFSSSGAAVSVAKSFEYTPNEFWVIQLVNSVAAGDYTISLAFNGDLTKDIVGFYRSNYKISDTETRAIATSKFEPTYARRAFPCFDEPSFKSNFTVTLVRPTANYTAFSNMPEKNSTDGIPEPGLTTVEFDTSVKMVTYLACFIVCDFKARSNVTSRGVPIRAISREDQFDNTVYPLNIGVKVTDYYEDYFGLNYALPKQDLIAIPDFVSGAMEHWGLVTFRETALLFNPTESSTSNQKRVATVVAHELAHQWFGNLMTVSWWDDLWLNEGFASYMEYKGTNAAEPTWDIETQILTDDVQVVMALDAKLSSHPIVVTVNHPDEITALFDTISYSKGSSVLRMLEYLMEPEKFQKGIQNFLVKYEYENAATPDLWHALEEVTPELNISRIMDTWTRQMGFPLLTCVVQGNQLIVSQTRFLADPGSANNETVTPSPYNYKWDIPVGHLSSNGVSGKTWMYMENASVSINISNNSSWVKLNAGQYGFFRVNYPDNIWQSMISALVSNITVMSASDRWGIIDDSFSLAAAGILPYNTALSAAKFLKNDRHPTPWVSGSDKLTTISDLVYSTALYPGFRAYIISLVKEPFADVGWGNTGDHLEKSLRTTILSLACASGLDEALNGAGNRFTEWMNGTSVAPDVRSLVYRYGMSKIGDATAWNLMWERFLKESDPQESIKYLYGLAFPKDPWLIQQYLEFAKNDSLVRSQDYFTVLQYIAQNPVGLPIVWDFIRSEWDYLVNRFTLNNRSLGTMVGNVCSHFTSQLRLNEMKACFAQYPDAGAGARARQQALETVQNNIKWLATNQQTLADWLKVNGYMKF